MLNPASLRKLERRFSGRLILPGSPEYESARRIHNGAIDRRPALIAVCGGADDVCRAVEFARQGRLPAAVRSGGHSQLGHSLCDGGIVIDLSGLKRAGVEPDARVARAQAGIVAGELDWITQVHGFATVLGQCPSVGIGGLATGGGFGWLTGKYGLTCDNVIAAQVVTADGRKLSASKSENQDLFWAIRGGGGNYGVVTEFHFRLHPITRVVGGMLSYPPSQARAGFGFMRDFVRDSPDELNVGFGLRPVGKDFRFTIALCFCGDPRRAARLLEPLHSFATPAAGEIKELSYLEMQVAMGESPPGCCLYNRGGFLRDLSDPVIDVIVKSAAYNPNTAQLLWLDHYHGAMCRVPQGATAFPVREPGFGFLVQSEWHAPQDSQTEIAWVNETVEAMKPFSSDIVYVANLAEEGPERVRRCYGPNYTRLAAIKRKYDPDNFFRLNQNITPAKED